MSAAYPGIYGKRFALLRNPAIRAAIAALESKRYRANAAITVFVG